MGPKSVAWSRPKRRPATCTPRSPVEVESSSNPPFPYSGTRTNLSAGQVLEVEHRCWRSLRPRKGQQSVTLDGDLFAFLLCIPAEKVGSFRINRWRLGIGQRAGWRVRWGPKGSTRACSHGAGLVDRSGIFTSHASGRQPFGILLVLVDVDYL